MDLPKRVEGQISTRPGDGDGGKVFNNMRRDDRRVAGTGRRLETIIEAATEKLKRARVRPNVDAATLRVRENAQIVDAVSVVGMIVGVDHAIDALDPSAQKLLAQVGGSIHQDDGAPLRTDLLHQNGTSTPPVFRIIGIAGAPVVANAGDAGR